MAQKTKTPNQLQFNKTTIGVIAVTFIVGFFLGAQYNVSKQLIIKDIDGSKQAKITSDERIVDARSDLL